MLILVTIITFLSTLAGGFFALRLKNRHRPIMAFSSGVVIGVAFFDLLPQALILGSKQYSPATITSVAALGFIIYMLLDRFALLHEHAETHHAETRGKLGAGSYSIHSFFDGVVIGLGFKTSVSLGIIVAAGIIAHDFSDGINTVTIISRNKGKIRSAYKWLLIDSLAPIAGVLCTFLFRIPESILSPALALFSGFFFYIGASDLLPESQNEYPGWSIFITIAGFAFIYAVAQISTF